MDTLQNVPWGNILTHLGAFLFVYSMYMASLTPKPTYLFDWTAVNMGLASAGVTQAGYRYGGAEATQNGNGDKKNG